jgi:fatty acid-binding protein DegV
MSIPSLGIAIDASCDVPDEIIARQDVLLLPVQVIVDGESLIDRRDPPQTEHFYRHMLSKPKASGGKSEPLKTDDMVLAFVEQMAVQFDSAIGVFVASSRSPIFARTEMALPRAILQARQRRVLAGRSADMRAETFDSKNLFAGYGALVMDLLKHKDMGLDHDALVARLQKNLTQTYAYMVPGNVSYILDRAAKKGEQSVGFVAGLAAKTMSITPIIQCHQGETAPVARKMGNGKAQAALLNGATRLLQGGLLLGSHLCLSYSGDLDDIHGRPEMTELKKMAAAAGVSVHLCRMSATGSVNVGPGALALGCVAKNHDPAQLFD